MMSGFRGYDHFIPVSPEMVFHHFSEIFFGTSEWWPVIICQIEMGNTVIEGIFYNIQSVLITVHAPEIVPKAQRYKRQFNSAITTFTVIHTLGVAVDVRQVIHNSCF